MYGGVTDERTQACALDADENKKKRKKGKEREARRGDKERGGRQEKKRPNSTAQTANDDEKTRQKKKIARKGKKCGKGRNDQQRKHRGREYTQQHQQRSGRDRFFFFSLLSFSAYLTRLRPMKPTPPRINTLGLLISLSFFPTNPSDKKRLRAIFASVELFMGWLVDGVEPLILNPRLQHTL